MEQAIFSFVKKRFVGKDVYEAMDASIWKIILQMIFVSLMVSQPIMLKLQFLGQEVEGIDLGFILLAYLALSALNVIFLLFVAALGKLMNATAVHSLTFRQMASILSYAATIPAVVSMIVGMFIGIEYVYLIYNFGTLFFAYFVYNRGQKSKRLL